MSLPLSFPTIVCPNLETKCFALLWPLLFFSFHVVVLLLFMEEVLPAKSLLFWMVLLQPLLNIAPETTKCIQKHCSIYYSSSSCQL
jgi:hypothetical protein